MDDIRQELAALVRRMVDEPDAVEMGEFTAGRTTVFELRVAPSDLGKVIGRQGRTARALRTLLESRGEADGRHFELDILED